VLAVAPTPEIDLKCLTSGLASGFGLIGQFLQILSTCKKQNFNRRVLVGDLVTERPDNAAGYGFGEGSTIYD
jgi:hypothetical protein